MSNYKPNLLKKDLITIGIFAGIVIGAWQLGKKAGIKEGYIYGSLNTYETVFTNL